MKKWAGTFALAGALWMLIVLSSGSLSLAKISNYPGVFASRWVQYRGLAPSSVTVSGFNVWLVLTSAMEWMVVGLGLRAMLKHLLRSGGSRMM